jgi:hypothetical protein
VVGNGTDAVGVTDRRTTEFLYQQCHGEQRYLRHPTRQRAICPTGRYPGAWTGPDGATRC